MIHSLRLVNFKGHRDSIIPLKQMTVLVGPNSSGKTSVLQALESLSLLKEQRSHDVFTGRRDSAVLARKGEDSFALELKGSEKDVSWILMSLNHRAFVSWQRMQMAWLSLVA